MFRSHTVPVMLPLFYSVIVASCRPTVYPVGKLHAAVTDIESHRFYDCFVNVITSTP